MTYHAHFDCFSGAAGDMMLSACLDAADSLPNLSFASDASTSSSALLARITQDLENGMPELKGEFELSTERVWRSMGRIAARKVDVKSVYDHVAAPVPGDEESHGHQHGNSHHHNHEGEKVSSNHSHEHNHHHEHSHQHEHKHEHSHHHNHDTMEDNVDSKLKANKAKEDPHVHDHEHSHHHGHSHGHSHSHDHSKLRNLSQITTMLREANSAHIPRIVASLAIDAFTELAHAEMHTHGASDLNSVHFHEVGAVDSIVDTVGTLLALYHLGVDLGDVADPSKGCAVTCSRLPLGEGTVWTDHGLLPVPAPAAMRLMVNMPTCPGPKGVTGELVTPTAAALLRVLTGVHLSKDTKDSYWQPKELAGRPPNFTPRAVGIGAGTKDFEKHANILRLVLGDETGNQADVKSEGAARSTLDEKSDGSEMHALNATEDTVVGNEKWDTNTLTHLEANIDDATPELLAHTIDLLLQNGAIDAWINPIVMKKGRPAHTLNCICRSENSTDDENRLLEIIFRHTTTLGIRIKRNILRAALKRRFMEVQLPYTNNSRGGKVNVKISSFKDGEVTSIKAEFDQCKIVSVESDVPLKLVASAAERIAWDQINV